MTKYAFALLCLLEEIPGKTRAQQALGFVEANSEDEAVGKCYRIARKQYPIEDGWYDHTVLVMPVGTAPITNPHACHLEGT